MASATAGKPVRPCARRRTVLVAGAAHAVVAVAKLVAGLRTHPGASRGGGLGRTGRPAAADADVAPPRKGWPLPSG